MRLPTYFLPHGAGPCFFMEWTRGPADTWKPLETFLRGVVGRLAERPRAILVVSGHWEEAAFTVGSSERPDLLFDYGGFPEETYRLTFPAPGAPDLAASEQRGVEDQLRGELGLDECEGGAEGVHAREQRREVGHLEKAQGSLEPVDPARRHAGAS